MSTNNVDLHDGEKGVVGEANGHNPEKAPQQSVDSVAKTDDNVKQAAARKGDQRNGEKMPTTKSGMINAMYNAMNGMKKEQLAAAYNKMMGKDGDDNDDSMDESTNVDVNTDFTEDLDALISSEATLSEEFKDKTAVIFETAVKSKITEEVARLEQQYQLDLDEQVTQVRESLVEKVDSYLNYVVENWMEENRLAVQQGLRTEIAEEFMDKLKVLFTESYIEVPESKVDLVDELANQVSELEEQLNTTTENAISMSGLLEQLQRDAIIREHSVDLAESQVEKLKSLVESVDFEDEEAFSKKVKTVRESYFNTNRTVDNAIVEGSEEEEGEVRVASASMDRYVSAIQRTQK